jgi:ABC-type phosphate transport system permease subunit
MMWRKFVNTFMFALTGLCTVLTVSVLFFILGYLVYHGGRSLSWDFFTKLPAPVGESGGGLANAIVGTGKLLLRWAFWAACTWRSLAARRSLRWCDTRRTC